MTRESGWIKGTQKTNVFSGKYDVHFGVQHLEGQFLVKYRKQIWICE